MTVIAAFIDEKNRKIAMACDSLTTRENDSRKMVRTRPKILRRGEFLIGMSGYSANIEIVRHFFEPPLHPSTMDNLAYMNILFIPELKRVFHELNGVSKDQQGDDIVNGSFLICYRGMIYELDAYLCVIERPGFHAIGSGWEGAVTVLDFMNIFNYPASAKVRRACEIASRYNLYCGGPIKSKYMSY